MAQLVKIGNACKPISEVVRPTAADEQERHGRQEREQPAKVFEQCQLLLAQRQIPTEGIERDLLFVVQPKWRCPTKNRCNNLQLFFCKSDSSGGSIW